MPQQTELTKVTTFPVTTLPDGNVVTLRKRLPDWMDSNCMDWRYFSRAWMDVNYSPSGDMYASEIRFGDMHEVIHIDGGKFALWSSVWNSGLTLGSIYSKEMFPNSWVKDRHGKYVYSAYLQDIPSGEKLCKCCVASKRWIDASRKFGFETEKPMSIERADQFKSYPNHDATNIYYEALKAVYGSHFNLIDATTTLKTMQRRSFARSGINRIVEELLALGVIVLKPSRIMNTTYVEYNESVDIEVAIEVISWHEKEYR